MGTSHAAQTSEGTLQLVSDMSGGDNDSGSFYRAARRLAGPFTLRLLGARARGTKAPARPQRLHPRCHRVCSLMADLCQVTLGGSYLPCTQSLPPCPKHSISKLVLVASEESTSMFFDH